MEEEIISLNITIGTVSKELIDIQKALDLFKEKQRKQEAWDEAGWDFVHKAEKVIDRAEKGEIWLTADQIQKIASNLLKIQSKLIFRQKPPS